MTEYFSSRRAALLQEKDSLLAAGENNNKMLQQISEQNQQINQRSVVIDALLLELDDTERSYREDVQQDSVIQNSIDNLVRPAKVLE